MINETSEKRVLKAQDKVSKSFNLIDQAVKEIEKANDEIRTCIQEDENKMLKLQSNIQTSRDNLKSNVQKRNKLVDALPFDYEKEEE